MNQRRVALLIESSRAVGRDVLSGIAEYEARYGPWLFCHSERSLDAPPPAWLASWRPDGIIARVENRSVLRRLARLKVPVVDVVYSRRPPVPGTVRACTRQEAVVEAAAAHLQGLGFADFAYCGYPGIEWAEERGRLFAAAVAGPGRRVSVYRPAAAGALGETKRELEELRHTDELVDWLRLLPKPVGLLACNDARARQVLNACRAADIAVPDDVAVVGVDNDELACRFCTPPLSSVDQNARRVGYEAAAVLDRLLRGEQCPPSVTLDVPADLVRRQSSDTCAVADPEARRLLRYVRQHACAGLTVEQLRRHAGTSLSTLKRRFARSTGGTPSQAIDRARLDRVKELLLLTRAPLAEVARRAGFDHVETMHRLFKRATGLRPTEFRDRRRPR